MRTFEWKVTTYTDSWKPGVSAGGCIIFMDTFASNPQFLVRLTDPDEKDGDNHCTMLVNLMQNDRAMRKEGRSFHHLGFAIYSLGQEEKERCSKDFFRTKRKCCGTDSFPSYRYVLCPAPDISFCLQLSTLLLLKELQLAKGY